MDGGREWYQNNKKKRGTTTTTTPLDAPLPAVNLLRTDDDDDDHYNKMLHKLISFSAVNTIDMQIEYINSSSHCRCWLIPIHKTADVIAAAYSTVL